MYCGQCGTQNQDEAGHCETCGAPLLITTGSRVCGSCGASLGDHDRFCTTCGTPAAEAAASEYDAADDFGELDIDDIDVGELPDWLQEMAPSRAEAAEPPAEQSGPANQPAPDDLPDWLRDVPDTQFDQSTSAAQSPPSPPPEPGPVSHQPAEDFSLVSDDDLPDWLKALSDDDDSSGTSVPQQAQPTTSGQRSSGQSGGPTTAVANLYEVPAVSRAWLTQSRSVDPDDVTSARQEFSPLESLSSVGTEQAARPSIWDDQPEQPSEDEVTQPFTVAQEPEPSEDAETGVSRVQLIIRIVVLVLIVIVVALLAFMLIQ